MQFPLINSLNSATTQWPQHGYRMPSFPNGKSYLRHRARRGRLSLCFIPWDWMMKVILQITVWLSSWCLGYHTQFPRYVFKIISIRMRKFTQENIAWRWKKQTFIIDILAPLHCNVFCQTLEVYLAQLTKSDTFDDNAPVLWMVSRSWYYSFTADCKPMCSSRHIVVDNG